jgi:hypothetical protein
MNHRGTETTESSTEDLLEVARTTLKSHPILEVTVRPLSKNSVLLCDLRVSVVN